METIKYISNMAIPVIIGIIVLYGFIKKDKTFDTFIEGAKEGILIVVQIFPTLLGLFIAIGLLRISGVLDMIVNQISPITDFLKIPKEVVPLLLLKPISGSASTAVATEIMTKYGVDSLIGLMSSTIMGATETTIYTIAIYTSVIKIKETRFTLLVALIGDIIGMTIAVILWRFLS